MTLFVRLRAKTYSYLIDNCGEDKNAKGTKKSVIERKLKFENYTNCLEDIDSSIKIKMTQIVLRKS